MKYILTLFFGLACISVKSQNNFTLNNSIPVIKNLPLELPWAGGLNFPVFSEIDLNGDNVPDLFAFDRSNNRSLTFINKGTGGIHCWEYAPQYAERFPVLKGWAYLYDYNCDNKPDLFTTNYFNNGIAQFRNESQGSNIVFTLVDSTMKYDGGGPILFNIFASSYLVPDLDDIDGDGDMDILGQQFQCAGAFAYYKNMSLEDYGVCDSLNDFVLVTNAWGDFSLRSGLFANVAVGSWNISCFQNTGGGSYELAVRDDTYANIRTIDIDGDGDKDALIGDSQTNNSLLVINGGTPNSAHMVQPQDTLFPSYDTSVNLHSFTTHSYLDLDNDGLKDLVVTQSEYENNKGVWMYKNTSTNAVPVFNFQTNEFLQNEMIDVGESATPVLFDYNADGLKDLIIGNKNLTTSPTTYSTGLTLYKNTGTSSTPSFEYVTDNYAGLQTLSLPGQIYPAFGDVDGDNDEDMILGLDNGRLGYFQNTAGPGVAAVFANPVFNYMGISIGQGSTPQLFDLDHDGLLDLVIGGKNGLVKYFRNAGSTGTPFFSNSATSDTLGKIVVQTAGFPDGYSVPFLFEQNGDLRLLVSCMKGKVYLYGNINGNLNGTFTLLDSILEKVAGSRFSYNLSVSGGDLNGDSLTDMLLGFYGGGIQIYYQDTATTSIASVSANDILKIFPIPASETIVVKLSNAIGNYAYNLYDITGRLVLSQTHSGNYTVLNVSGIAPGAYRMRVSSGNFEVTGKVIIER